MRFYSWCCWLVLFTVGSCGSASFGEKEAIEADLARVFTLNKELLLERRAALLEQIELVAAARQGSYRPLMAQSKALLGVGYGCYNFMEQLQMELLQMAKLPVAPDSTVPPVQQPHWRTYETELMNKKIGDKLLFKKSDNAEKLVKDWQQLATDYEQLLQEWAKSPVVQAEHFPFEDQKYNQLYRWTNAPETPAQLAQTYFEEQPLVTTLTRLLQLQADILAHEVQLLRWLLENISVNYLVNNQYTIVAQANEPVVPLGEAYQAKINLMAYPSQGAVELRINGKTVSTEGGLFTYKTTPTEAGTQTLAVEVLLQNLITKEKERYTHSISYEVLAR
jgi:hypothetical protein